MRIVEEDRWGFHGIFGIRSQPQVFDVSKELGDINWIFPRLPFITVRK